ncbi:MAG: hypothetical protein GY753_03475 [Gammaproteobacteria bacterium]|nr:hypothetical protein [Gammaproteobacteria bacterium]
MLENIVHFLDVIRVRLRIRRRFRRRLGYSPNLKNPQSYCEKVQWLKLNNNANDANIIARADKYLVRNYIEEKGLGEHLVTLYGCYDKPEDIDWQKLPRRFVLKLNNASGSKYRWFVKDKSSFSISRFEAEVKERMFQKFSHRNGEFHYGKIPPKIIAEEYLEDHHGAFKDYKFYCFHGKLAFLSVEEGKTEGHNVIEYYNTEWEKHPVDFFDDYPRPKSSFSRPGNFNQMVLIAETLSQGYPHLRVDLYNVNGQIYFGELTYAPESGIVEWKPRSLDFKYGKLMHIRNITH